MSNTIKINIERELTAEFLGDVLVTALDGQYGGSLYWCLSCDLVTEEDNDSTSIWKSIKVREQEDEGQVWHTVDHEKIGQAIQKILADPKAAGLGVRQDVSDAVIEMDAGCIDSIAADAIVQIAALGEITYG